MGSAFSAKAADQGYRRPWYNPGITSRLIGWFLMISLLPIIALLLLSQHLSLTMMRQSELTHLESLTEFKIQQINSFADEAQTALAAQLRMPVMAEALLALRHARLDTNNNALSQADEAYRTTIQPLIRSSAYNDFLLISTRGEVLFTTGQRFVFGQSLADPGLRDSRLALAVQQTMGTLHPQITQFDTRLSMDDPPMFVVGPIIENGTLIGIGAAQINPAILQTIISDQVGLGRTGSVVLGQLAGDHIMLINPARNDDQANHHAFPLDANSPLPIQRAIRGEQGKGEVIDFRHAPVLAVWRLIPALNWAMVVKIDSEEALALVERQRQLVLTIALITLAGVTMLALFASRSLTRPIRALTEAARRMGAGDLHGSVAVETNDELGELARSFNGMAADIRNVYTTIEEEVRRRTLQLESSNLALERARDELRKFYQVVECSPLAVTITNTEGLVEYVNPRFTQTTGFTFDEMVDGRPQWCGGAAEADQEHPCDQQSELWKTIRSGQEWHGEFQSTRKNGESFWAAASIFPVQQSGGGISHFVAIQEDISPRKTTEEQLRNAKDSAESANRAKSEFLAVMSHEIRTPMNGILGMTQLMLDTPLSGVQRDYLDTIHHSSEALLTLLNDILDFSKLEAGRIELEAVAFDLTALIASVMDLMRPRATEKRLNLSTHLPALPPQLHGDPSRLRQILLNLLGNAVKFTDQGSVELSVIQVGLSDAGLKLRFTVQDTGIGIADDIANRLFQSFSQADTSISRRYGGSGLGLAICRRLVELQGGVIGVESEPGKGSQFWFTLTYAIEQATIPVPTKPSQTHALPRMSVLLAEDNVVNRKVAAALLEKWGHIVTCVTNGLEAVEAVQTTSFDVVLMDMQMPEMDGVEATHLIRAMPSRAGRIPIIALTANAMRSDEQLCYDAGMDDYVSKPIEHDRLFAALERVYARRLDGGDR